MIGWWGRCTKRKIGTGFTLTFSSSRLNILLGSALRMWSLINLEKILIELWQQKLVHSFSHSQTSPLVVCVIKSSVCNKIFYISGIKGFRTFGVWSTKTDSPKPSHSLSQIFIVVFAIWELCPPNRWFFADYPSHFSVEGTTDSKTWKFCTFVEFSNYDCLKRIKHQGDLNVVADGREYDTIQVRPNTTGLVQ